MLGRKFPALSGESRFNSGAIIGFESQGVTLAALVVRVAMFAAMTQTDIIRPRCDPPDYASLSTCGTAKEAWLRYVKTAARPYTFKSFELHFNLWRKSDRPEIDLRSRVGRNAIARPRRSSEEIARPVAPIARAIPSNLPQALIGDLPALEPTGEEFIASEQFWRARVNPKAKVLSLRTGASLRVANGLFEISEQLPLHLSPDGAPHVVSFECSEARRARRSDFALVPKAIILPEHGWRITAEALKFCLSHDIALLSVAARTSQGEKGLISILAGEPRADADLVRAQCRAKPIKIARDVVRQAVQTLARRSPGSK